MKTFGKHEYSAILLLLLCYVFFSELIQTFWADPTSNYTERKENLNERDRVESKILELEAKVRYWETTGLTDPKMQDSIC